MLVWFVAVTVVVVVVVMLLSFERNERCAFLHIFHNMARTIYNTHPNLDLLSLNNTATTYATTIIDTPYKTKPPQIMLRTNVP